MFNVKFKSSICLKNISVIFTNVSSFGNTLSFEETTNSKILKYFT